MITSSRGGTVPRRTRRPGLRRHGPSVWARRIAARGSRTSRRRGRRAYHRRLPSATGPPPDHTEDPVDDHRAADRPSPDRREDGHRRPVGRRRRRPDVRGPRPGDGPGDGHRAARRQGGRRPRRRGRPPGVRRPEGLVELVGQQARPDAGQAVGAGQGQPRGAGPAREPERRQADQRGARRGPRGQPRVRVLRRGREQGLRRDDPGQQARPRLHPARADRGRRPDRALELPDADGQLEARAGAGGRQHLHPQAGQLDAAQRDPARRAGPRGGLPRRASSTS